MQLAVGDFVSAANTISEEQVNEVIFDYNFDHQVFKLGNIEINTEIYWNIGSQLEEMVRKVHRLFNTSNYSKPATLDPGSELRFIFDDNHAESLFIDFGKCSEGKEYFLLDGLQKPWLRETSRHLSKRELFERKFEAQLYAYLINKFSSNLAVDSDMKSYLLGGSSDEDHQEFYKRLFNGLPTLNEVMDYGDLATSIMDVKGLYSLIGDDAVPSDMTQSAWFNDFKTHWSNVYHEHGNMDWESLKEQVKAMVSDVDTMLNKTKFRVETYWEPTNAYHDWGFNIQFNLNVQWYLWH
jgi:hypothetical protein